MEPPGNTCHEDGLVTAMIPAGYPAMTASANEFPGSIKRANTVLFRFSPCGSRERPYGVAVRFLMIGCVVNCQLSLSMVI